MEKSRFEEIKNNLKIENENLTYDNYLEIEGKLEHGNAPDWLSESIKSFPEEKQEEIKIGLVNEILTKAENNNNLMYIEDAIELNKDYLEEILSTEELIKYNFKEIDWNEVVEYELNNGERYTQIGDVYYSYLSDNLYQAASNFDNELEISQYEIDSNLTRIEELSGYSDTFDELSDEDKVRAIEYFNDNFSSMDRNDLEQDMQDLAEDIGMDNFNQFATWDEDEVKGFATVGYYSGADNEDNSVFCITLNINGDDKYLALQNIANNENYEALLNTSEKQLNKEEYKDIVLNIVKQDGCALEHCSDKLKDDKEVALTAVSQTGYALDYCSPRLKDDKEVAIAAVSNNGRVLEHCSEKLRDDKEVALAAVSQDGTAIKYCSDKLKDDKEVALTAVSQTGYALDYCSPRLKDDKEFVRAAVSNNGRVLEHCSEKLRDDKEVALAAVSQYGRALEFCSTRLKDDKEVALAAVSKNGWALEHCSENIQKLCNGMNQKESIETLTKAIESTKLHEQLQKIVPPKTIEFARNLSEECKQASMEQSQQVAKVKPKMKI